MVRRQILLRRLGLGSLIFLCAIATSGRAVSRPAASSYTIAFKSFAPNNTDIFIADADGKRVRPLVPDPTLDYNASFSADGRWIVFTSHRSGAAKIYRVHPDGSGLERLTDGPAFDDQGVLSPDGKRLAFVSSRGGQADIWVLDLATRKLLNLTNHPAGDFRPAWSPDSHWIAFSSDRDPTRTACPNTTQPGPGPFVTPQYTGVYMAHPDGSALRRISAPTEIAGTPHWSPDGTHVAYWAGDPEQVCRGGLIFGTGTTQIVSVNLDSGARDTVTSGAGVKVFPRWVGAGRIVYQTREGLRFVGDDSLLPGEFQAADWSPDHRAMVFHREIDTRGDRDRPFQSRASLDRRFALLRVPDASSFAPAGDRMVYMLTNFNGPLRSGTLMVANADGSDRHAIYAGPLTEDMTGPAWSPRGDWIAFTSKRDGDYEIYRIRPDGSGLQRLTRSPGNDAHQVFSPDGEWIAFATARQGFKDEAVGLLLAGTFQPYGEIAFMRADGSDVRLLTDNSTEEGAPSWIPRQHR